MGSIVHYGFLHRVEEAFGDDFLAEAKKKLVSQKVADLSEMYIDGLHFAQTVTIGEDLYTVVYEWASEEEMDSDEVDQSCVASLRKDYVAKVVKDVSLSIDRDDELLLYVKLDNDESFEIKIGVNSYEPLIEDWFLEVIGEDRINEFLNS